MLGDITAQRRATACLYFYIALGKSLAVEGIIIFLLALAPLRHLPRAATCYLESLYFSESLMKSRRALPSFLGLMMRKNPASGCQY
jgi:hypothetical protein